MTLNFLIEKVSTCICLKSRQKRMFMRGFKIFFSKEGRPRDVFGDFTI